MRSNKGDRQAILKGLNVSAHNQDREDATLTECLPLGFVAYILFVFLSSPVIKLDPPTICFDDLELQTIT